MYVKRVGSCIVILVLAFVLARTPTTFSQAAGGPNAATIARDAATGVGSVTLSSAGTVPGPVVLLEERHNSRVGQLLHAITMTRLHDRYDLRDIVLEGFLRERPPIDSTWFKVAIGTDTPVARAAVAVQFLKQGEISAAEFVKLTYTDVQLLRSETQATYLAQLPQSMPPMDYLDLIRRANPAWAAQRDKNYATTEALLAISGDQHLALATEIKQYAETNRIAVPAATRSEMEQFITFWQKRMASNVTMAESIPRPSPPNTGAVAVEIGAFHTAGLSALIKNTGRPYAVVRPLYTPKDAAHPGGETHGDLTGAMYERKNAVRPVFAAGAATLIFAGIPGTIKPEPVIATDFFQAEGEFYALITNLAHAALGGGAGGGPPKGPPPTFGLDGGDFDRKSIRIDLQAVQFLPGQPNRRNALLIPVTLKRNNSTIWVGVVMDRSSSAPQGASVESILLQALRQVQSEQKTPEQLEDARGRAKLDDQTIAFIGRDQAAVRRSLLAES